MRSPCCWLLSERFRYVAPEDVGDALQQIAVHRIVRNRDPSHALSVARDPAFEHPGGVERGLLSFDGLNQDVMRANPLGYLPRQGATHSSLREDMAVRHQQ